MKTLPLLARLEVPPSAINVFVADAAQRDEYRVILREGTYGEIVVGARGMGAARRAIQDFYDEGEPVFCVDDDIKRFVYSVDRKRGFDSAPDVFTEVVIQSFASCRAWGMRLWGMYPVANPFFMRPQVTTDLRYIVGAAWGCLNSKALRVSLDDKEDFERTILFYLADRGVIRNNFIAVDTNYYGEPGGMQTDRTHARIERSAMILAGRYPRLCRVFTGSRGFAELRLKDRRTKIAVSP